MEALNVSFSTSEELAGLRPHTEAIARHNCELAPYQLTVPYTDAKGKKKTRLVLTPFMDIMHRIFRISLFPRVGNLDMVHDYLVNMLLLCEECKNTSQTLDVCDIMWEELYSAVMDRKVPIYGPYLQVLFERAWADYFDEATYPFPAGALSKHGVVVLRIKDKWSGGHGHSQAP